MIKAPSSVDFDFQLLDSMGETNRSTGAKGDLQPLAGWGDPLTPNTYLSLCPSLSAPFILAKQ